MYRLVMVKRKIRVEDGQKNRTNVLTIPNDLIIKRTALSWSNK
ncbi:MAG: hypothetical protein QY310_09400 [Candidatus Jettenia sp. CY-1]|nr:MAG: hypothetical protein QY310_09400 [Candidatus Jettenia sp. CY-1]